jgi:hypothetical protein
MRNGSTSEVASGGSRSEGAMKLDVPHDYVLLLITALEHHYAYTRAVQRDGTRDRWSPAAESNHFTE